MAIDELGIPVDRGWATDERVIMEGAAVVVDVIEVDTIEVDTGGAAYEVAAP